MNFEEFKTYRDQTLKENPSLFRLECMNAYKALEKMKQSNNENVQDVSVEEVVSTYIKVTHFPDSFELKAVKEGVVHSLTTIFNQFSSLFSNGEFIIPEDVYPVYFKINHSENIKTYPTIGGFDLMLEGEVDTPQLLVITYPLKPSCYALDMSLQEKLMEWVEGGANRFIVIDGVYTYQYPTEIERLLTHPKSIWLSSISKAFLSPKQIGFVKMEKDLPFAFDTPSDKELENALSLIKGNLHLPSKQMNLFSESWKEIIQEHPFLSQHLDDSPSYLKTVPLSFEVLRDEHGISAVPISVFGSKKEDYSVVSCLLPIQTTKL